MKIRAVLFDFDDTLCLTGGSREERALRAHRRLREEGYEVNWRHFWHALNALDDEGFYRRGMQPVVEDLGLSGTPLGQECIDLWFFKGAEDLLAVYDGCIGVLEDLKQRYRLGVITNGPEDIQRHKFDSLGLGEHFELFLTSGAFGSHKPDPAIFHHALQKMDVTPDEAIFVGDHLDLDVIGAQRAGMRGVWFNPDGRRARYPDGRSRYPDVIPDAVIRRHADIQPLLDRWAD